MQITTDTVQGLIVDVETTQAGNDFQQLIPAGERMEELKAEYRTLVKLFNPSARHGCHRCPSHSKEDKRTRELTSACTAVLHPLTIQVSGHEFSFSRAAQTQNKILPCVAGRRVAQAGDQEIRRSDRELPIRVNPKTTSDMSNTSLLADASPKRSK